MGSTGKTAFGVILGIGAVTGILCYYAFSLVAPEPGVMSHVSREPAPEGASTAPIGSSNGAGGGGESVESQPQTLTAPATSRGENATATASNASSSAANPSAAVGSPKITLTIPNGASVQGNPSYEPTPLTVKVGDTIAVENKDISPHTVTNGKDATDPTMGKLFDTSIINAKGSSEIATADLKPGEYPFFCSVHPYMTGSLTVQ
jgi:plastocyanin